MPETLFTTLRARRAKSDFSISIGLFAGILFFLASGFAGYWNIRGLNRDALAVSQTHETINALDGLLSLVKDAETGQRGYVLTGDPKYLEPYNAALTRIDEQISTIKRLQQEGHSQQLDRLATIDTHIHNKLSELAETIELRRSKGFEAARDVVITDRGKNEMDIIRAQMGIIRDEQREIRSQRLAEMESASRVAIGSGMLSGGLGLLLSLIVTSMIRRAATSRQKQEWLQSGEVGLSKAILGEQRIDQLGENILRFLAEYLDAHSGVFYTQDQDHYRRNASYGLPTDHSSPSRFVAGEGLLGQAAKDGHGFIIRDVPEGYLAIGSALGQSAPRHLAIAVAHADGLINAVFELGFVHPLDSMTLQLLEASAEVIGIAVKSANYRAHLQNLLEETQRQSEELQAQGEELRVNNEELEEQSRVLKESQFRLEQQQAEMEQTNAQLEEQTQILEHQRDELSDSRRSVELKAEELERASQYKSDFLANMSHELRTPLNSSLILAKLLGDNSSGNLSEEQIKFARTIESAGNDLLALINDILDLSKIEAGHMEIRAEELMLERMASDLTRTFEPLAKQKGLSFATRIASGLTSIDTDRQRLEQVLKNLLANALKFTDKGSVELMVRPTDTGRIEFAVTDTGIGIAAEQQQAIFDAFRQADGTISRRYGGTGLGLSISRELTRLLGGTITLKSEAGRGSTFAVTLPPFYDAQAVSPTDPVAHMVSALPLPAPAAPSGTTPPRLPSRPRLSDDRSVLTGSGRLILVVEDDASFARILYDLAHEQNFQCLIAGTAEEALTLTRQYLPSALVLDVGLPDNSGLSVLDRLKQDPRTRHIPIHVVSANDYAHTAYALGAVGYMLKPVKREQLAEAFEQLETRFAQRLRRVLIVEDDLVQLDSVRKLLASQDVETVGATTAAECLALLKENTFDCMVLDLSLPDASGYALLETLNREEGYAFPPVIVYTGRELSGDEEQRLRRHSKSIIIKGAKSPERLLDEVTLFLHQVVADLPPEQQQMIERARNRDAVLEQRHILVVEDDVRNVYALTSILEPRGAVVHIARNGREALEILEEAHKEKKHGIDLVLMDVMMPEMDGLTATREIRKHDAWKKLPVIMLTAKAMKDDQERCLDAGANDYMAKPLDVEKLLSLVRVWMPR